jgi:alkylation response protein AidB-like acyl-CoA dehydrogenase
VRAFIAEALPAATRQRLREGRSLAKEEIVGWQRRLNERGWATPSWPREHGWTGLERGAALHLPGRAAPGTGAGAAVVQRQHDRAGALHFGSDEQKRRFLPRIANLDDWWCQGFSEPGAGSDLAALKTSAKRVDDHYIVSGQKMWQGMAQHADWMFTLVRTDPVAKPQAGITMLLIDMRSPGITVRPILTIDGRHEVNEVFLDDVRVPLERRVGAENQGWDITKFLLGNERSGIARIGMAKQILRRAKTLAATIEDDAGVLADSVRFREQAALIEIELKALEITQMRVLDAMKAHATRPDARTSILKVKGTELRQAASELLLQAAGPEAARWADELDDTADAGTTIASNYFTLRAASIYGGSNEVQKNILAKTVLGL